MILTLIVQNKPANLFFPFLISSGLITAKLQKGIIKKVSLQVIGLMPE